MKEKYYISLNSTLCYVIAFLATTILHELAHALVGKIFSSAPVMHHNFVVHYNFDVLMVNEKVLINLAGPLISLLQGLLFGWIFLKTRKRGLFELFMLWFAVLGLFNFIGYVFSAPFFNAGDIREIYSLIDVSLTQQILFSMLGAIALLLVAYKMTVPFLSFSYKQKWVEKGKDRKSFSFHALIIPWVIGSVVVTVLYLPIIALISIFYPIMSGFIFIYPWQNATTVEDFILSQSEKIGSFSTQLTFAFIAIAIFFKVVLSVGIEF